MTMKNLTRTFETRWRDAANLLLGLWLLASPWALSYGNVDFATWNAWALGAVIAMSAIAALVEFHEWEEWVSAAFGLWLAVSPWVLGYTATVPALWNHVVVGLAVAGMAGWSLWSTHQSPRQHA